MKLEEQPQASMEQQLHGLSTLILLENKARQAEGTSEFGFIAVNETMRLFEYHQAVFWAAKSKTNFKIKTISGVPNHDANAPYLQWLNRLLKHLAKKSTPNTQITIDDLPLSFHEGWKEWAPTNALFCPLIVNDQYMGGLLFLRDREWADAEIGLAGQIIQNYGFALFGLINKKKWWQKQYHFSCFSILIKIFIFGIICSLFLLPIRLSVLSPAQIVAIAPQVMSAPFNGVIKKIHVQPNQKAHKGQSLFSLDDTNLNSRLNVVEKAMAVVQAELIHSQQKSLLYTKKSSDTDLLKVRLKSKSAEVAYAASQLEQVSVFANQNGIVLFDDINNWLGKPVVTGEKIMTVADSNLMELEIHVPINNAINLEPGAEVKMFLNINPTLEIAAKIRRTSYEAQITKNNELAFIVKADLIDPPQDLRIGLHGTAKIFGEKSNLFYYLFRRPMATMRKKLGM